MRVATRMPFPPYTGWRRKGLGETGDQSSDTMIPGYGLNYPVSVTPQSQPQASATANQIAAINAATANAIANLNAATAAANAANAAHESTILPTAPQGNPVTAQVAQQANQTVLQAQQTLADLTSATVPDGSTAVGAIIYGSDGNYVPSGPATVNFNGMFVAAAAVVGFLLLRKK